jgi:hypothetical protein
MYAELSPDRASELIKLAMQMNAIDANRSEEKTLELGAYWHNPLFVPFALIASCLLRGEAYTIGSCGDMPRTITRWLIEHLGATARRNGGHPLTIAELETLWDDDLIVLTLVQN